jgi:hypothetical protein
VGIPEPFIPKVLSLPAVRCLLDRDHTEEEKNA